MKPVRANTPPTAQPLFCFLWMKNSNPDGLPKLEVQRLLRPVLAAQLALPGGAQTIALALGATGATFLALSGWVLATRRDFSFMGGFLFAGMVIAILAGLAAMFFQMPALGLAVSATAALLSAGLILYETSRIVTGGKTNHVLATVGQYLSIFNLFTSLLNLFGIGGKEA